MTNGEPRKRGRPPVSSDPHRAEAYQTIGRTVWQLMAWGFDLRQQVAPAVARLAADILKVQNADGQPLTPHRIEQVFEQWLKTAKSGWVDADGRALPLGRPWSGINIESLRDRRPFNLTHQQLAEQLLRNQGEWRAPVHRYLGDPVLTQKAHEEFLRAPRGRKPGN